MKFRFWLKVEPKFSQIRKFSCFDLNFVIFDLKSTIFGQKSEKSHFCATVWNARGIVACGSEGNSYHRSGVRGRRQLKVFDGVVTSPSGKQNTIIYLEVLQYVSVGVRARHLENFVVDKPKAVKRDVGLIVKV